MQAEIHEFDTAVNNQIIIYKLLNVIFSSVYLSYVFLYRFHIDIKCIIFVIINK